VKFHGLNEDILREEIFADESVKWANFAYEQFSDKSLAYFDALNHFDPLFSERKNQISRIGLKSTKMSSLKV